MNCSHHAVQYIRMADLVYNWVFVPVIISKLCNSHPFSLQMTTDMELNVVS